MDDGRDRAAWPDPDTAERLLRRGTALAGRSGADGPHDDAAPAWPAAPGHPDDAWAAADRADPRFGELLRLLSAAARHGALDPGREQAAVAAFRAARGAGAVRRGRPTGLGARIGSGRPAKALAGGLVAVFAVGGVAFAAGTGALPTPFRGGVHARALPATGGGDPGKAASGSGVPRGPSTDARGRATPGSGGAGSSPGATGVPTATATPDPSVSQPPATPSEPSANRQQQVLRALCRSYVEAVRQGRDMDEKPLSRLQRRAGGQQRVAAFCRRVLAAAPAGGAGTPQPPADR